MIQTKEFWNKRSQVYDAQVGPVYEEAYRKTIEKTRKYIKKDDLVLDFACGTGIITTQIASCADQIYAIDISDEMVRLTQNKIKQQGICNIDVCQRDIFDPELGTERFDVITAYNVLCYLENFGAVMDRIRSLLKPEGLFISATDCLGQRITKVGIKKYIMIQTGRMPYEAFYTTKKLERKIAASGFDILECENLFLSPPNLFIAAKLKKDNGGMNRAMI